MVRFKVFADTLGALFLLGEKLASRRMNIEVLLSWSLIQLNETAAISEVQNVGTLAGRGMIAI